MKIIRKLQKYAIYAFFFSLNFETMDLFNLGINYLASKITVSILLLISIINFRQSFSLKPFKKYLIVIIGYFILLTIVSIININASSSLFFDFPFFLNIVLFTILCNYALIDDQIVLKGLYVLSVSSFTLSLLYLLGIGVNTHLEGRFSIFGMNENVLGMVLCISIFTLTYVIFTNCFNWGKLRYLNILMFPSLFAFLFGTGSRTAFICFILGAFLVFYYNKSIPRNKKILMGLASILPVLLIWFLVLKNTLVAERLFDTINEGDLSSRDLIWVAAFGIIIQNYIIGVGETGYAQRIFLIFEGDDVTSPHNVLIEVVCYTGIIGLIIFLIFFWRIAVTAWRCNKYKHEILPLIILIPLLATLLSGQIFQIKLVWTLFAYIAASGLNIDTLSNSMATTENYLPE